ncbi:hypothetical protein PSR1_03253 [Anaeromyxobacter sp. PSR-1]|nr:hypothetical protein PSR1_03253 [Anaeromyxobacter sp. PSR-1]
MTPSRPVTNVSGMARLADPLIDADFRALVEALAREGLPRRAEAARAVEAVACALADRTRSSDFAPLREVLPEPFRGKLSLCERHRGAAPARPREPWTAEAFEAHVAEDLGPSPGGAEAAARAVFAALRAQLPEEQAEEVGRLLPPELLPLWRRPS